MTLIISFNIIINIIIINFINDTRTSPIPSITTIIITTPLNRQTGRQTHKQTQTYRQTDRHKAARHAQQKQQKINKLTVN